MKHTGTYPTNWPTIATAIKALAFWRCEACNAPDDYLSGHVLTTHHLNGDKCDCRFVNLVALCQRCHLKIQARYHPARSIQSAFPFHVYPTWITIRGLDSASQDLQTWISRSVALPKPVGGKREMMEEL